MLNKSPFLILIDRYAVLHAGFFTNRVYAQPDAEHRSARHRAIRQSGTGHMCRMFAFPSYCYPDGNLAQQSLSGILPV
jgi:hypothetical protein